MGCFYEKWLFAGRLKLIACLSMLIDHIGYAVVYPLYAAAAPGNAGLFYDLYLVLRSVGRLAFPIFCFLLTEGLHRTRSPKKYALRLAVGAVLAEMPYNLLISGELFWPQQSVMVTLLLSFLAVWGMQRFESAFAKSLVLIPFAILAEVLMCDYGWAGVVIAALFEFSREMEGKNFVRFMGLVILSHYVSSHIFQIGNIAIPMQVLCALSVLFIAGYDGSKRSRSKLIQWGFYLFYPAHMLLLYALRLLIL